MKKFIATLLALLMLTASFGAVAQAEDLFEQRLTSTITLSDVASVIVGDRAVDQVIGDVLNALTITAYEQGDEVYYALGMRQESGDVAELLTMGIAQEGDDLYIASNLIGGTIVISPEDIEPLVNRLIDVFVQLGFIDESDARMIQSELPAIMEMMEQEMAASINADALLAGLDPASLNLDALMAAVSAIGNKVTVGEVGVLPRNCDAAQSMLTLTLTPEDVNSIVAACLQFIIDNPALSDALATSMDFDNTIAPQFAGIVDGRMDLNTLLSMLIEEIDELEIFSGNVVARVWLDADSMPVAMEAVLPIDYDNLTLNYTRLTMSDAVAHTFVMAFPGGDITMNFVGDEDNMKVNMAVAADGVTMMSVAVDYADRSTLLTDAYDARVEFSISEVAINGGYSYSRNTNMITISLDIDSEKEYQALGYVQNDAIAVSLNGREYFTVNVNSVSGERGASITEGNVVRPAALSDADFANWFIGVYSGLSNWLLSAIYAMPSSVINLINTGF